MRCLIGVERQLLAKGSIGLIRSLAVYRIDHSSGMDNEVPFGYQPPRLQEGRLVSADRQAQTLGEEVIEVHEAKVRQLVDLAICIPTYETIQVCVAKHILNLHL